MIIFEDESFFIEVESSEIPWLKIFTKLEALELSDLDAKTRSKLWELANDVELVMREYYRPAKINIASFANVLPRVHLHIMARFCEDSHFPNPMWGEKLRDSKLDLPCSDGFYEKLRYALGTKNA
ncbi:MAG: HIT family protein [Sulfuricurvum sp.]